jgi:hypothetical protein
MKPSTIGGINQLPPNEKREIYLRVVPPELLDHFHLNPYLVDEAGRDLARLTCPAGSTAVEMEIRHRHDFPDPVLYGHLTDTLNGQIRVLLYIINDPSSPRFDVDRMPDGTPTKFGTVLRNLEAEEQAMEAGLAPGQVRAGLRLLSSAIRTFEGFVAELGHDLYFIEPLYYHNAMIFERHGFAYQTGKRRIRRINEGFAPGGELLRLLDSSTPFRRPEAARSIRLRSWAIHDGLLSEPLHDISMYKVVGRQGDPKASQDIAW